MIAKINVGVGGDPTVDVGALRRQLERVGERYELGDLSRGEWIAKRDALQSQITAALPRPLYETSDADAQFLGDLADLWANATQEERVRLAGILCESVHMRGDQIASVKVRDRYLPLLAAAAVDQVVGAPPDGLEPPTPALGRLRSIH